MKTNTWICPFCEDEDGMPLEFKKSEDYMKHNKEKHPTGMPAKKVEAVVEPQATPEVPKAEVRIETRETRLTYKFVGSCPVCGKEVDTIELDVGEKEKEHFCIAWCNACKKNLVQRRVVRL